MTLFIFSFSICALFQMVQIDLSSSPLILSSTEGNLLQNPSGEFFISDVNSYQLFNPSFESHFPAFSQVKYLYVRHCGCFVIENLDYAVLLYRECCSVRQLIYRWIKLIPETLGLGLCYVRSVVTLPLQLERPYSFLRYDFSEVTTEITGCSASSPHTGWSEQQYF